MKRDWAKYERLLKKRNAFALCAAQEAERASEGKNRFLAKAVPYAVAPVLFDYAHWILSTAASLGIRRLYFLSRDGFMLLGIARQICEKYGFSIECRYLYTSRLAARIPAYHLMQEECLEYICEAKVHTTLRSVLENVTLDEGEQKTLLSLMGLSGADTGRDLSKAELSGLRKSFAKNDCAMEYVYGLSRRAHELALSYFAQEGLFDDVPMAFADVGWRGTLQVVLGRLLGKKIPGFYFGLFTTEFFSEGDVFHAYLFSPKKNRFFRALFNNSLFECFCSAPDGMTAGYKKDGDATIPVFASQGNANCTAWHLEGQAACILFYAKRYLEKTERHVADKSLCKKLLVRLMAFPSRDEADFYGRYLFSDETNEEGLVPLAPPYSPGDFVSITLVRYVTRRHGYTKSFWRYGSIRRSNLAPPIRAIFWLHIFCLEAYKAVRAA